jgi:hypothetical protein
MDYFTHADIKAKVERALDLEDEIFITPTEMLDYHNEAIDECEAEIHTLYEDYFLAETTLSLVNGTSQYTLPADMYANKLRSVIYNNGSTIYKINKMRRKDMFEDIETVNTFSNSDYYQYYILNNAAFAKPKMVLVPAARETASNVIKFRYIRNANRMEDDDSICDIPEFSRFVIEYIKMRCYEKEGHPNLELAANLVEQQRKLMQETLSNMVPDADTAIEMDLDVYGEHS